MYECMNKRVLCDIRDRILDVKHETSLLEFYGKYYLCLGNNKLLEQKKAILIRF